MGPKHIIILKDGESLTGEIMNKSFVIRTSYAELNFTIDKIANIHFKNPPQYLNDEMVLITVDKLKGDIITDPVNIILEASGESIKIEKDKIHTIIFLLDSA